MTAQEAAQVREYVPDESEDWLRRWPYVPEVVEMDKRVQKVGRTLRHAPEHVRAAARSKLWWIRFNGDPTIAELVRVGLSLEEAERRVDERLRSFNRAFRA